MTEWRLFEAGTIPGGTTPEWCARRNRPPYVKEDAHRGRLELAASFVAQMVNSGYVDSVVDLGCGDGSLLALLQSGPLATLPALLWGYELPHNGESVAGKRGVDVRYADVTTDDINWGRLAICTEMLEHLIDPHAFLRRVAEHSPWLVASSPFAKTDESHCEYHTWAWDLDGYRSLIEQAGYGIMRHETISMFQVVLGRKL